MPKIKHSARKASVGSSARAAHGAGSDNSQERGRPFKRAAKRPTRRTISSSEGSDYEEEIEYEEQEEFVEVRKNLPNPSTRRPSYNPSPLPDQPQGDARRISLEPPPSLGREIKDSTKVAKSAYLKFRRDTEQFSVCVIPWTHVFTQMFRQTFSPLSLFG